jgi:SET domain-containing protein
MSSSSSSSPILLCGPLNPPNDENSNCFLYIKKDAKKGYCVFTSQSIPAQHYICRYQGELISRKEAKRREKTYPSEVGSYMFFFRNLCIDASLPDCPDSLLPDGSINLKWGFGRYFNHSVSPNCQIVRVRNSLHIHSIQEIDADTELSFHYGEGNKETIESNPWLVREVLEEQMYEEMDELIKKGQEQWDREMDEILFAAKIQPVYSTTMS